MINYLFKFTIVSAIFGLSMQKRELVTVSVVFRHGDRTATYTYPLDPYNDILYNETEAGELTYAGKNRQYLLGKFLRARYEDFLPQLYSRKDIYVVSDDMDRCLMSAAANLADAKLLWGEPFNCPYYYELEDDLYNSDYVRNIDEENKDFYAYINNHTQLNITSLRDIGGIYQVLYIESEMNLELPEWTKAVYPGKLNELAAISKYIQAFNKEVAKFSAGPLLRTIINGFKDRSYKMLMYSAHDTNIAQLVYTIAPQHEKFCPEFGSMVIFELWRNGEDEYVEVYLKRDDNVTKIEVEGCEELCSLSAFKSALAEVTIEEEKLVELCRATSGAISKTSLIYCVVVMLVLVLNMW
ncbi:lysosomal acid phosphatase-like isoform X2 [Aethina tumida]|uniref:lysosomal acid phosphatase-like isoform X2 n=1 Tax=Aethina tumida TaxID=116153 RepID=UPI002148590F|nr:lysosomal acid phosphatase-like isoform X2 [Aethina tumida]